MPQPTFRSIEHMPLVAHIIATSFAHTQELHRLFLEVQAKSHVLDQEQINRAKQQHREGLEMIDVYWEQLELWETQDLTATQKQQITELHQRVKELKSLYEKALKFIAELYGYAADEVYPSRGKEQALKELQEATDYMVMAIHPTDRSEKRPVGLHISQMHLVEQPLQLLANQDANFYQMLVHIVTEVTKFRNTKR